LLISSPKGSQPRSLKIPDTVSVRRVKGLLGLSPLGLISRLLRGQVRPLLYIRR
jgi:hypothetical protein